MAKRVIIVASRLADHGQVRRVVRWLRALLPATALVLSAGDVAPSIFTEGAITLDADSVSSGPLSLADALARAGNAIARAPQD